MIFPLPTIVGIVASAGTAASLLPQLVKILKNKKAEDVSLLMLGILFTGVGLWILYGILKKDWIIIISNSISLLINACIVGAILKYKGNKSSD